MKEKPEWRLCFSLFPKRDKEGRPLRGFILMRRVGPDGPEYRQASQDEEVDYMKIDAW